MKHAEAIELLPHVGSGQLDADTEDALALHAEECAACRGWWRTRDLLATSWATTAPDEVVHPDSALLALCVIRPEELDEPDRSGLRRHLDACPACRDALRRVRSAVQGARQGGERSHRAPVWRRPVAAGLIALLVAGGVYLGSLFVNRADRSQGVETSSVAVRTNQVDGRLSGSDLDGVRVIHSAGALTVADLTVRSGADITLEADEVVAFADGFQVDAGARLRVGAGRSSKQ